MKKDKNEKIPVKTASFPSRTNREMQFKSNEKNSNRIAVVIKTKWAKNSAKKKWHPYPEVNQNEMNPWQTRHFFPINADKGSIDRKTNQLDETEGAISDVVTWKLYVVLTTQMQPRTGGGDNRRSINGLKTWKIDKKCEPIDNQVKHPSEPRVHKYRHIFIRVSTMNELFSPSQ